MLIYLIAGEPSGDMIGARLIKALKAQDSNIEFAGVGGDNMQNEGMKSLFDITDLAIMGLVEVIPSIPKVLKRISQTTDDIIAKKPDMVITIDSWSFSARVHKSIRKKGFKVLQTHYVAPQVWAWKKRRAKTMYKYIDNLLTLFPNEPQYFTPYNLPTEFVGHPAIESSLINSSSTQFFEDYNISKDKKIVLVLPGSRHNEIAHLLPTFIESVNKLNSLYNDLYFVLPTVKTVEHRVRNMLKEKNSDILVLSTQQQRYQAMKSASFAIAASGTVALELAIIDIPHLITYKVPRLTAFLARLITKIKYANLTNILLDKPIIPELLQEDCTVENIVNTSKDLLDTNSKLYNTEKEGFIELREALGMGQLYPSQRAAQIILKLIKESK